MTYHFKSIDKDTYWTVVTIMSAYLGLYLKARKQELCDYISTNLLHLYHLKACFI